MVKVGQAVKYIDESGQERDALVTAVWSETCVNLVLVNNDLAQRDDYGQKIQRETSQVHCSVQTAPGRYWWDPEVGPFGAPPSHPVRS